MTAPDKVQSVLRLPKPIVAFLPLVAGAVLSAAALPSVALADAPCVPPAGRYDFSIDVSGLGQVGALTGIVKRAGAETRIDVETQIVVRMAGIVVHRHVETRRTVYRDGRLLSYAADIRSNGSVEEVRVVRTAGGLQAKRNGSAAMLPAEAVPGFPWARCFAEQGTVFGLRSTRPSRVEAGTALPMSLVIGGRDVPAHEIRFVLPKSWVSWFADDGTLLRHAFDSSGRRVTLTRVLPKK